MILATSSLLNQSLSPTNLINGICDEADQKAIKNLKSKNHDHDAAFVTCSCKKGSGGLKKLKKEVKCWNCHKRGILQQRQKLKVMQKILSGWQAWMGM